MSGLTRPLSTTPVSTIIHDMGQYSFLFGEGDRSIDMSIMGRQYCSDAAMEKDSNVSEEEVQDALYKIYQRFHCSEMPTDLICMRVCRYSEKELKQFGKDWIKANTKCFHYLVTPKPLEKVLKNNDNRALFGVITIFIAFVATCILRSIIQPDLQ